MKKHLSTKEEIWPEILCKFFIFPMGLKPGKIHVLRDDMSRAAHVKEDDGQVYVNYLEVPYITCYDLIGENEYYMFFRPVVKAMGGEWPGNKKQVKELKRFVPLFEKGVRRISIIPNILVQ